MDPSRLEKDAPVLPDLRALGRAIRQSLTAQEVLDNVQRALTPLDAGGWLLLCSSRQTVLASTGHAPKGPLNLPDGGFAAAEVTQVLRTPWLLSLLPLGNCLLVAGSTPEAAPELAAVLEVMQPHLLVALQRMEQQKRPELRPEFMDTLFAHMQEGVAICDATGTLQTFNPALRHLHGGNSGAVSHAQWPEKFHLHTPDGSRMLTPEEVPLYRAWKGEVVDQALLLIRPPGLPDRYVQFQGGPVRSAQGELLGALVTGIDMTGTFQQEQQLHTQHRLIQHEHHARASSEHTLRYTSALLRISEALLEGNSPAEMGQAVLSESREILDALTANIYVTDPDHRELKLFSSLNVHASLEEKIRTFPLEGHNPVSEVARTGKPLIFSSKEALCEAYPDLLPLKEDIQGPVIVLLPLALREEVLGVLHFGFGPGRRLAEEEHSLMRNIAKQVAQALERTRLYQQQDRLIHQHQETLAMLQALMHNAPIGLAFLDDQLSFKMVNRPMARMLNSTIDDFLGARPTERFPLFGQLIEHQLKKVLDSGESLLNLEYSMPPGMGRPLQDWLVNYFPVRTPEGETLGIGATIQDITHQKASERILQESQLFREKIMQTAPVVIYLMDLQAQHIVYSNQHMAEVLGYTPQEVEHMSMRNMLSLVHHEDLAQTREVLSQMQDLQGGDVISLEARFRHKSGSWRWFFVKYTLFSRTEESLLVLGLALDITEQKQFQEALNESEQRFKDVSNSVPILIWMSDAQRNRTFFNRTWLEFTGSTTAESAGTGWTALVHPEDIERYLHIYHQNFEARTEFQIEYRLKRFDGQYRWILARGVPRFDLNGNFLGFIGGCIEMHDRKVAEEALKERETELQQVMNVQKRFVADAAHELRTPLTAIQGNLDILIRHPHIPEDEKKEIVQDVQREATRLGRLVNDMLQLARGDSGLAFKEEEVDLHRVLHSAFRDAERFSEDHHLELGKVENVTLYGDRDRLKQLLLILLENAVKYTPAGGTIRGTLVCSDSRAEVRISDNGIGIAEEDIPRVFERFYRVDKARQRSEDPGGTGLGLPIARWIVDQHGGKIWIESEVGKGTTVVVQLRAEPVT
ncbi:PAS domain S-box protein [Deinococcus cellulosilyticus]|uniref:histidine kinase n=1 Tax=Deinococcus cellulosilyticus (strain DSM 18568 / NBRC 106333 / KACC 11606 / 5516J-15) TaxID=1223518 RepID=A0A511MV80_DEIC1|nr:PAS domain S-box protein [Deinococcus cellulosilyticus]GEM44485.1 hypothetical protein DC3_01200 [Deinococcus cellulosilyticus NBRC 106333 = KACC 11606]